MRWPWCRQPACYTHAEKPSLPPCLQLDNTLLDSEALPTVKLCDLQFAKSWSRPGLARMNTHLVGLRGAALPWARGGWRPGRRTSPPRTQPSGTTKLQMHCQMDLPGNAGLHGPGAD